MENGYWKMVIGYWVEENDAHTNQLINLSTNKPTYQPFNQ